tara:strand:- start:3372 stop:3905 length:534 start_codon:yes stop_codon:yes gene_type:complete
VDKTKIIASSNDKFQIELVESLSKESQFEIFDISKDLEKIYGRNSMLNEQNIDKYFNESTLPFIARYQNNIIGFIIGVPLENFKNQSWVQYDENLGKNNTLYTYAFVFKSDFRGKHGFAKTLKKIFSSWAKKRAYNYISGHINENSAKKSSSKLKVIKKFNNWYESSEPFVYYRREI